MRRVEDGRPEAGTRALQELETELCRSLGAGRYDEARRIAERCVACGTPENYEDVVLILRRARRVAEVGRALASDRLADVQRAVRYSEVSRAASHYLITG